MTAPEPLIGLEIHVQLSTRTKLFCGDVWTAGAAPNSSICPVCVGLPGALPVLNDYAVELAVRTALGLGCSVHPVSCFDRKQYFYPDLPKGYQITQHARPLATAGSLEVPAGRGGRAFTVRIRRVHLEEDAGKLLHEPAAARTRVDLNRSGVPLVEIVTEPDLRTAQAARKFLLLLRQTLRFLHVSDCDMENGSLRVDANVSIPAAGAAPVRTELKNLNSFAHVEQAIEYEVARQSAELEAGRSLTPVSMHWDPVRRRARPMRSKASISAYRYVTEPDLPPLRVSDERVARIAATLPELPAARAARLAQQYGLPARDVAVLLADEAVAAYFERVAAASGNAKAASNWVMTVVRAWLNRQRCRIEALPVPAEELAVLIRHVAAGDVSHSTARRLFQQLASGDDSARELVRRAAVAEARSTQSLDVRIDEVLRRHPDAVERYRAGETRVVGFLMGELMRTADSATDARAAMALLEARLAQ